MTDHISPLEQLLDEKNCDNIILYDETDAPVEFEQIAVIPIGSTIYAILRPVVPEPGMADDEALVFAVDCQDDDAYFRCEVSDEIVDRVFEEYYEMLGEHS